MSVCHYKSIPHVNVLTEKCPTCPCVTKKVSYMSMCHHESVPHMGWVDQTRLICTRPLFKNWYGLVVAVVWFCIRICLFCVFSSSVLHPTFFCQNGEGVRQIRVICTTSRFISCCGLAVPACLSAYEIAYLAFLFASIIILFWDQSGGGGGGRSPFPVP